MSVQSSTFRNALAGLLLLQLLLAAGIYWNQQRSGAIEAEQALVVDAQNSADRIVISDAANNATLRKQGGHWQLPALKSLPVDTAKLSGLLEKLAATRTLWPVTTSKSSHQRFQVDEENYQRHITIYHGNNKLAEFYIGTSPGFRKVHLRRAGETEVYSVPLSTYDFPSENIDWLDKRLLSIEEIRGIEGETFALRKVDNEWHFDTEKLPEQFDGRHVDKKRVEELVSALGTLRVQGVTELPDTTTATSLKITEADQNRTYQFIAANDNYYVLRDDIDAAFTLAKSDFEKVHKLSIEKFAAQEVEQSHNTGHSDKMSNG